MNRRDALLPLFVLGVATHAVEAQRPGRTFQIGYVGNSTPSMEAELVEAFRLGLRERGHVEGKNIVAFTIDRSRAGLTLIHA